MAEAPEPVSWEPGEPSASLPCRSQPSPLEAPRWGTERARAARPACSLPSPSSGVPVALFMSPQRLLVVGPPRSGRWGGSRDCSPTLGTQNGVKAAGAGRALRGAAWPGAEGGSGAHAPSPGASLPAGETPAGLGTAASPCPPGQGAGCGVQSPLGIKEGAVELYIVWWPLDRAFQILYLRELVLG